MILARLSNAIREQNWFAVAIEFVIVVTGVMLAFQITAWNTERQDAARVDQALERLQLEAEQNIRALRQRMDANSARNADQAVMVSVAMSGELPDEDVDQFERAIAQLMYFSRPPVQQSTYHALEQSGDLALIADRELIVEINRYQGRIGWVENQHGSFRRGLTTFTDTLDDFIFHEPTGDPAVTRARVDFDRLNADPARRSALVQIARMHAIFAHYVTQLEDHTVQLCHRLAAETGRACDEGAEP
ncbi:hypothetical protein [Hyphobacterium marinum]|uniref:Uncharacterized protein n=1 Tax=Hyphobacterium marinum TaxID=3116574 RepID=A0ABU7LXW5_9PROT|nr:hypothetical protein [Hyphobacterium sp. Y6023]MEE2566396.1 hypothetical protein [Hyphobacterium sp. Y6023]